MAAGMQEALKKVGVKIKINKRLWLWLKDQANPRTAPVIAKALGMDVLQVYPVLSDLYYRGMVSKIGAGGANRVYAALGSVYEVKPRTVEPMPRGKVASPVVITVPPVAPLAPLYELKNVEAWGLEEAYQVYRQLHTYFGAKL